MTPLFRMLAAYSRWANARALDAAAGLPDADYRADLGAFFRSVHGTLNHMVVADRIWLHRFTGEGVAPTALDAELAGDIAALRDLRREVDARYAAFVDGLSEEALAGTFTYRRVSNGELMTQVLAPALMHAFNHQTHHRGQLHALLTRLTGTAPAMDLIYFPGELSDYASPGSASAAM